jgi:DNA-binding response OmpR family regulator
VVLLDLKLPLVDGFDVLREIKFDPVLCSMPVVVLSTSSAEQDRVRAYKLHANSYLAKPLDFSQFEQMIQDLKLYWCGWNEKVPAGTDGGNTHRKEA